MFLLPGGRPRFRVISAIQEGGRPRRRPRPRASLSSVRIACSTCSRSSLNSARIFVTSIMPSAYKSALRERLLLEKYDLPFSECPSAFLLQFWKNINRILGGVLPAKYLPLICSGYPYSTASKACLLNAQQRSGDVFSNGNKKAFHSILFRVQTKILAENPTKWMRQVRRL